MSIIPAKNTELLAFVSQHLNAWSATPSQIGLTAAQVTQLSNLLEPAQTKYADVLLQREQVKAATLDAQLALRELRAYTGDLVNTIRAFAQTTNNELVYVQAQIPPPQAPSAVPPPTKPIDISVALNPDGSITLKWKSDNSASSSGAYFEVARRLGSQGNFVVVGGSGSGREFTDATIPAGSGIVSYIITPRRGTRVGTPSDQFNVQFGVNMGGGGLTVSGYTVQAPASNSIKIAA